ncbi:hypothetical protein F4780DRAFT_764917 [Xylariomycetidae sp. FL0641]|nr:hypothetical protein F4780DRAFT_764917 [Xylariomycetidae sp. FL0641]
MEDPSAPHARARSNVAYACESCRAAKVKCQSESPSGICKRCSEFRRQCVYRTGPRTRRPKLSSRPAAEIPPPPPPPGKTFSFDFSMPAAEEPDGDFEELRMKHEGYFKELVPDADPADEAAPTSLSSSAVFDFSDLSSGATPSTSCPSVSSRPEQQPIANLGIKPQFNLDSAADLLASFRHMLPSFPCLVLPPDTNVRTMAREAPFVLLAILAVTSCSVSLQSHSLYDEEFRKVLGLKFVAGGERSLELLQGLLVYCSWYPLHVRPKNKQVPQYMRMAVDLVHDLELDQEHDLANPHVQPPADALPRLRALLASFYCASSFAWGWGKPPLLRHTSWVAACGDALEARSPLAQDHALVWLARFQSVLEESNQLKRRAGDKTTTSTSSSHGLLRLGLDAQLRAFQARVPEALWAAYRGFAPPTYYLLNQLPTHLPTYLPTYSPDSSILTHAIPTQRASRPSRAWRPSSS